MKLNTKRLKIRSLTTTATARTDDDVLLVSDAGGSWTLTLPPAANCINKVLQIKKTNSSSNTVTVDGNGAETIDGATTFALKTQYEVLTLISDGSNWQVLFSNLRLLITAAEQQRSLTGYVGSSGTGTGDGFTSSRQTTGWYRISFTNSFPNNTYSIAGSVQDLASCFLFPFNITTTGFDLKTVTDAGAQVDRTFTFTVSGDR